MTTTTSQSNTIRPSLARQLRGALSLESTILALSNVFYHWGSIIVPPGYTDPLIYSAGGNPYGASHATGPDGSPLTKRSSPPPATRAAGWSR
jgi:multimeric flavodoxin WrbA